MRTAEVYTDTCVDVRACSGVLIVDKPTGTSSGYASRKVGRHFGLKLMRLHRRNDHKNDQKHE